MDAENARRIEDAIRLSLKPYGHIGTEYLKLLRFVVWGHILNLDVDAYESP